MSYLWASTTWKMSPATMCSLATSTARWYMPSAIVLRTTGGVSPGWGGSTTAWVRGRASFGRATHPHAREVVLAIHVVGTHVEHGDTLDEVDALTPVVEGGHRADDTHHRVGQAAVVAGHVGQMLDLADHVVAEVAHDPSLQAGAGRA